MAEAQPNHGGHAGGASFVGPIVLANVYTLTHSYGWAFASLVIPSAAALACLLAARAARKA